MGYTARVLRVMIASPSDTIEARNAVEAAIYGWNGANAQTKQIILQPWRWESAAVPVLGGHPQELINAQGVDESDIVFGLFWSRLGMPTAAAVSGTVEELERAVAKGKPVHVYFSTAPLPVDVDTDQLDALRHFKTQLQERGLLGQFSNPSQLGHEVWKAIEHDITLLKLGGVPTVTKSGVRFLVQPQQQREISGYSGKNNNPRYRTRHWIEITNQGTVDAEEVVFEPVGNEPALRLPGNDTPTVIHAGQTRTLNVWHMMGGDELVLRIRWVEDGEPRQQDFHVG